MKKTLFLLGFALVLFSNTLYAQSIDPSALYQDYCSVCHGDKGDGKSHAQQGMVPPPRDFTSPESAILLNRQRIEVAIRVGVPGTAMAGWESRLSEEQISALANFVQKRFIRVASSVSTDPGSKIYADYCSVCHGDAGQGAVWARDGLSPPPVDFTDKKIQASLSREHMIDAVSFGRPETAMTGWKDRLSDDQIATVVDYVINTFMPDLVIATKDHQMATTTITSAHSHASHMHTEADMILPFPNDLHGDLARGKALYTFNCSVCHGEEGDGRGPRAYFINPKPRDFLHTKSRASLNRPTLFEAVSKGSLRTEMPAWDKVFDAQQIADVSEYVFKTFIKP